MSHSLWLEADCQLSFTKKMQGRWCSGPNDQQMGQKWPWASDWAFQNSHFRNAPSQKTRFIQRNPSCIRRPMKEVTLKSPAQFLVNSQQQRHTLWTSNLGSPGHSASIQLEVQETCRRITQLHPNKSQNQGKSQ